MKIIVYKNGDSTSIVTPGNKFLNQAMSFLKLQDVTKDKSDSELQTLASDIVAEKDIPRLIDGVLTPFGTPVQRMINKKIAIFSIELDITYEEYFKLEMPEYKIVDSSKIPIDDEYRNALEYNFSYNVEKSKEIKKRSLRIQRAELFEANDIVLRDAVLEADDTKKTAGITERDRLRNITNLVDDCKTMAEIKAVSV